MSKYEESYNLLKEKDIKLVFICGQNRSGTTLMQSLLDGHSQFLVCPVEDGIARVIAQRKTTLQKELNKGLDNLFNFVTGNTLLTFKRYERNAQDWGSFKTATNYVYDKTEIQKSLESLLREEKDKSEMNIIIAILCSFFPSLVEVEKIKNTKYIVLKTPKTELYLRYIEKVMPDSYCIYLFREPLQTFFSALISQFQDGEVSEKDYIYHIEKAKKWKNSIKSSLDNVNYFSAKNKRALVVTYEDLCNSLESEIAKLADFLGIRFEESLYCPTIAGHKWEGNSVVKASIKKVQFVQKEIKHPYKDLIKYILYKKINRILRDKDVLNKYYVNEGFAGKYRLQELFPKVFIKNKNS